MPARGAQRQAATIEEVRAELEAAKRDKDTKKKLSKLEGAETYRAWYAELLVLAYGMGGPIDDMIKQGLKGDASGDGNPDADNVTERRKLYPHHMGFLEREQQNNLRSQQDPAGPRRSADTRDPKAI
jgi:hypothetical protein